MPAPPPARAETKPAAAPPSPLRVLAVEDEPEVLDLVRATLTHAGHSVLTAASGREALEAAVRAGRPATPSWS